MKLNPRYSQRAFALQLGLSPGELSEVLRGKRALSVRSVLRISKAMGLSPDESRDLMAAAQLEKARTLPGSQVIESRQDSSDHVAARELSLDLFHVVSDWYCFAILNLAETTDFRFDAGWIGRRLGISTPEVRIALERLERVGLIERAQGKLRIAPDTVIASSGVPSEAIKNYHRQILNKAIESLELQSVPERDISGVGIAIHPRHIEALKNEISEFQDRMIEKYSRKVGGKKTEVYQLEVALFRLTQSERS